jgi:hypothetical protein
MGIGSGGSHKHLQHAFQDVVCSLVPSHQSAHAFDCIARHVVLLDNSGRGSLASSCRCDSLFGAGFLDQSLQIESVLFRGEERRAGRVREATHSWGEQRRKGGMPEFGSATTANLPAK